MKRFWGTPPELRYVDDAALRARYRAAAEALFNARYAPRIRRWDGVVFIASVFVGPAFFVGASFWEAFLLMTVVWSFSGWLFVYLNRRRLRSCLREVMAEDGVCCAACGYSLRANVTGVCPECGTEVTPGSKYEL